MESLENKLDRLTPDQRREVEDFVDFLIQRAEGIHVTVQVAPVSREAPPVMRSVAPPLISADPLPAEEPALPPARETYVPPTVSVPVHEDAAPAVIQEIAVDDGSDGYFDYGKFEKAASPAPLPPSPADEAIKKVKRKLIQKSEQASKTQLLEWID
jgi:hypothetical protein